MKSTWDNVDYVTDFSNLDDYVGFVYRIEELNTGKYYFGIKKFWTTVKKKPTKYKLNPDGSYKKDKKGKRILNTRTTKKHIQKESDWKTYKTSSPIMQQKLTDDPENYYCEIIRVCKSVSEMKAHEAYYQLDFYIKGRYDMIYNEVINLRLRIR